jgi:hypothetical protein
MKNYTIIYLERWQSGSHWHQIEKMARVCGTPQQIIEKYPNTVYIFEGLPLLEGQTEINPFDVEKL